MTLAPYNPPLQGVMLPPCRVMLLASFFLPAQGVMLQGVMLQGVMLQGMVTLPCQVMLLPPSSCRPRE